MIVIERCQRLLLVFVAVMLMMVCGAHAADEVKEQKTQEIIAQEANHNDQPKSDQKASKSPVTPIASDSAPENAQDPEQVTVDKPGYNDDFWKSFDEKQKNAKDKSNNYTFWKNIKPPSKPAAKPSEDKTTVSKPQPKGQAGFWDQIQTAKPTEEGKGDGEKQATNLPPDGTNVIGANQDFWKTVKTDNQNDQTTASSGGGTKVGSAKKGNGFWDQIKTPTTVSKTGDTQEVTEKKEGDFWSKIKPAPVVKEIAVKPKDPATITELMLEAQSLFDKKKYIEAEALFDNILTKQTDLPIHVKKVIYQWQFLALFRQDPLPLEKADVLIDKIAAEELLSIGSLWNLSFRFLLRQVYFADYQKKRLVFEDGLKRLLPFSDDIQIDGETFGEIDTFLALSDRDRGVDSLDVLNTLLVMTPNMRSLRQVNQKRIDYFKNQKRNDELLLAAKLQLALSVLAKDEFLTALDQYESEDKLRVQSTAVAGMQSDGIDSSLRVLSQKYLKNEHQDMTRRRNMLMLLAGQFEQARDLAIIRFMQTDSKYSQDCYVCCAAAQYLYQGDLAKTINYLDSILLRLYNLQTPNQSQASMAVTNGNHPESSTKTGFSSYLPIQQKQIIRTLAQETSENRAFLATNMITRKRDADAIELAISVLRLSHEILQSDEYLETLISTLRSLDDHERSVGIVNAALDRIEAVPVTSRLKFAKATFLYQHGQIEQTLSTIEQIDASTLEDWRSVDRVALGLIKTVVLIKFRRLDDADKQLEELEKITDADLEQLAQVSFLRGWICLNKNDTQGAMTFFKKIVDKFAGSSYASKARQLIQRLEIARLAG